MAISLKKALIDHVKQDRRYLRRFVQQVKYSSLTLRNSPVFFANSFPKSGTHLLTQILEGFPKIGPAVNSGLPAIVMYEGASGRERSTKEILRDLRILSHGDIAYGHLHAKPEMVELMTSNRFATFFILRDPRDVVVSHVHYVTDMEPNHVHHAYYTETLKTFEERLRTSILGRPDAVNPFPDIKGRFDPFIGWTSLPTVFTMKYEDLLSTPEQVIDRMIEFTVDRGFQVQCPRDQAVKTLLAQINPQKSPTFRSGKKGGWRKAFTPEITTLFKDVAGDLLIQLGYEEDKDW